MTTYGQSTRRGQNPWNARRRLCPLVFVGSKLVSAIRRAGAGALQRLAAAGVDNAIAARVMFQQLCPRRDAEPARECVICLPLKTPVRRLESLKMEVGDDLSRPKPCSLPSPSTCPATAVANLTERPVACTHGR